ncbi:hypothetical protein J3E72DRAFT_410453 [Bipolaris maydis]|nr:hypothetical protein J3E72DRAFT_410453 [Bipolaris maydis]
MDVASGQEDIQLQRCPHLIIKTDTPKTIIDICPVLILGTDENKKHIENTSLYHYTYNWPQTDAHGNHQVSQAVVFGLGSMFNHSTQEQNVGWMRDLCRKIIIYRALRDIPAGEELCISYGSHLTFKDADMLPPTPLEDEIEQLRMIEPY